MSVQALDREQTGAEEHAPSTESAVSSHPILVIGGGPAGIRVAQELTRRGLDCIVFNAERWLPYNRVKLTPLLSGDAQISQIMQTLRFPGDGKTKLYSENSIVDIDREAKVVTTSAGRIIEYDKLVFATGSRAHVPAIPGFKTPGVFTFRNLDDVELLLARSISSRGTVIIGGGLLGLEAARGMANRKVKTFVVEHERRLMFRQLDDKAAGLVEDKIKEMGIHIHTSASVKEIIGEDRVEKILLSNGEEIACDTVIICTGIRANRELALEVGLSVGRGITVNEKMQTSDPDIYAIGECAEHNEKLVGLVGPAFEQAVIAARHIAGDADTHYQEALPSTKLKVVGLEVFSIGDVEQLSQRGVDLKSSFYSKDGVYRRIILSNGHIVGCMAVGDWDQISRVQELVRTKARIYPWQRLRFEKTGQLLPEAKTNSVRDWPRAATVCNCTGVNRGQIGDAIALGAASLEDIRQDTGASTVCGSCQILISELLEVPPVREPVKGAPILSVLAATAFVFAFIFLTAPVWPLAQNVLERGLPEALWLDGFWKQVSGYTLLGLSTVAAVLSLRKRISWLRLGDFAIWRVIHLLVGAIAVATLFVHTGFRLGDNLNLWLMMTFLALSLAGAIAGLATAFEHRLFAQPVPAARTRSISFWLHLITFWPLPVLLGIHILTVYYY